MSRQGPDVLHQHRDPIGIQLGRLVGEVVPAEIRRYGAVVPPELGQLVLPGVPELGEAVQEEDQGTLAGDGVVQPDAVHLRVLVGDHEAGAFPLSQKRGGRADQDGQDRGAANHGPASGG